MSLVLTGDVRDVVTENVPNNGNPFQSTTITMLCGDGSETRVEQVRTGKDFTGETWPKKGDTNVALRVVIATWAGKSGSGYRLTALGRADAAAGLRRAPVAS